MKQPELDLFDPPALGAPEWIGKQTVVLPGFALPHVEALLPALRTVLRAAPFRNQLTPGGRNIEVAITNCGALGWISDRQGYRYSPLDPLTGKPWPALPALLEQLRSILAQVTLAVEYVLLFVLAAGMAVLFSGLQATLDERIRQGALLRALGAERQLLIKARRIEFGLLGAVSGLLAAIGSEVVSLVLYRFAFDLPWHPHPWLLVLPLIGAALIFSASLLSISRRKGS